MNFKEFFFDYFGLFVQKKTEQDKISKIIKLLLPFQINFDLIRLGENSDGGYLIPNDLEGVKYCYSAGVGDRTKFENDLYNLYNIKSILSDPNHIDLDLLPPESKIINKKIKILDTKNTLSINKFINSEEDIIFKMDIEGDEYVNLINLDERKFDKIRILVIEMHNLRDLRSEFFFQIFEETLKKLNKYYYICHIHPNNSGKVKKIGNYNIPDMLEVTFINKNRINLAPIEYAKIPHKLDRRVDPKKEEIYIDQKWFL